MAHWQHTSGIAVTSGLINANLYIITDSPNWAYGEVKSCDFVSDPGESLRKRGLSKEDLLNCAGWFSRDEYITREQFAVTFKEKGYDAHMWNCLKIPEGIICN